MSKSILIAEPCELLRIGLKTVFAEDQRISNIHEVATCKSLEAQLGCCRVDLVIVNQSLITNILCLPPGKFIVLASKLDLTMLKASYKHKGRGYLSENVSAKLLRTILDSDENAFLIEPSLTPYVMESICGNASSFFNDELLTPREKEIAALLNDGLDRATIARSLCISEATLKTHIRNMARKR